jgi:oligoendopeptidase F
MPMIRRPALAALTLVLVAGAALALERTEIDAKYKWDLTKIYPSDEVWGAAKAEVENALPGIAKLEGTAGKSPEALLEVVSTVADLSRKTSRISTYASMKYHVDQRVGESQKLDAQAAQLRDAVAAATAWVRPEILAMGPEKVRAYVAKLPALAPYRQPLEDVIRRAPHTLDGAAEELVARAGAMASAGSDIRNIFVNADLPYPEVTLSTGETVALDAAAYTRYRAVTNRDDRNKVFDTFWTRYGEYTRTLGTALNAEVRTHVFQRDVRKFDTCLEAALFSDNIPVKVYTQLLDDVNRNLPTLHRYLALRKRMMGLDTLGYEDLYAPIVAKFDRAYTPEEAMELTLRAVAPLGREYQEALRKGLYQEGWVDWFPSAGKRSGAYSTMVYGLQPFQLQNFTGLYDEVSTFAHESGHSMHSYLAAQAQPFPTADYPIFVAEVASTVTENFLVRDVVKHAKSDEERLFYLGSYLDGLRTTLFRQTQFAEFELRIHEMVERGEPLTGDSLNALYLDILKKYYGDEAGVTRIRDLYAAEWAYIPHFYYNFYVYQYATSVVAAVSIADRIRSEGTAEDYLAMLSAGSSRYAFDLLKDAGVDMTTSKPFDAAMREMNRIMDEMETILNRKKGA